MKSPARLKTALATALLAGCLLPSTVLSYPFINLNPGGTPVSSSAYGSYYWPRRNPPPPAPAPAPNAPTALTIDRTQSTAGSWQLSWSTVSGATYYLVEESALGGTWGQVYKGSATRHSIAGKRVNGDYFYRVAACNRSKCSTKTATKKVTLTYLHPTTLSAPTLNTSGTFDIRWDYATSRRSAQAGSNIKITETVTLDERLETNGAVDFAPVGKGTYTATSPQYTFRRSVNYGYYYSYYTSKIKTGDFKETTGTKSYRAQGYKSARYSYRLHRQITTTNHCHSTDYFYCGLGIRSQYSKTERPITVQVARAPTPPPLRIQGKSGPTDGSYTLAWSRVTDGKTYRLQRRTTGSSLWTTLSTGPRLSHHDTRRPGHYQYRLQACNPVAGTTNCGPTSPPLSLTVQAPPPT
ncbi:MAG: hypothetical protein GDA55_05350, partial [Cellvibrionales bacterium]|nr:hypothetical protein [Cellvibrionales bacterium]